MTDLAARAAGAFLGAAVGDALGWPQENRSSNVDLKAPTPAMAFRSWQRRSGGRFTPYEEEISAGDYSDDTQMLCAVARSVARGPSWYEWLTAVELPAFAVYQRGAGRSLLAACRAWTAGVPPWDPHKSTNPGVYFNAGGNGGAMRVLPHAIAAAAEGRAVDKDRLFRDVTATHGHPRAALGAAVQAAALHAGLNVDHTLGYGELIEALLDRTDVWASLPQAELMPSGWLSAWTATVSVSFEEAWRNTVNEMTALLGTAQKGMNAGALASEQETLKELGCTGAKPVGSGTVSAAGAVYLASRAAANPRAGLLAAAYLLRADTDTLASMTASILGAFAGQEWMAPLDSQVQDSGYIVRLASAALEPTRVTSEPPARINKAAIDRFVSSLDQAQPRQTLKFLDGRTLSVETREPLRAKTESASVERVRLRAGDGQTLHAVRVRRRPRPTTEETSQPPLPMDEGIKSEASPVVVRVGVKVPVVQLGSMRRFYEEVVGMTPTRVGGTFVTLNDILALSASEHPETPAPSRISIYLDVLNIQTLWQRVQDSGVPVIDSLAGGSDRQRFRCLDPEGNLLEIREGVRDEGSNPQERGGIVV